MKRTLLIAIVILGCCLGLWKAAKERAAQRHSSLDTTEAFISFASQQAVADAETYDHVKLDYSIDSLKQVDQILGRAHDTYLKNPSSVSVRGMSAEYGVYVGEVIRRSEPNVYWTRDSQASGEKSYPLHWNGDEAYPLAWCAKRITNGDEDSIWSKYSRLKDPSWRQRVTGAGAKSKTP